MDKNNKKQKLLSAIRSGRVVDDKSFALFQIFEDAQSEVDRMANIQSEIEKKIETIKQDMTPTESELLALIKPLIPQVEDGHTPTEKELLSLIKPLIPQVKDGISPKIDYNYIIDSVIDTVRSQIKDGKDASVEETAKKVLETIEIPEETGESIISKINDDEEHKIKSEKIDGFDSLERLVKQQGINSKNHICLSTGTGGGHIIQDEGTSLTQRTKLNFKGAGVTVTDDPTNDATMVTIPGGSAGSGDVVGPASAVDSNFAAFDTTTGKLIKDSGKKAADFMAAGSVTQYTDEMAQDAVGNAVGNGLDYDDSTGAISVDETELAHNSLGSKQGGTTNEYYHLTSAQSTVVGNTSGTNTGDNATNTTSNSYADGKVADAINDGTTTIAPSQNAVFDALALKASTTVVAGKKPFHGVVARPVGASSPLPTHLTTTTFTLGATANPISYYYQGTLVAVTANKTATLDDGAGGSTAGLYFVYFNAALGTILATKTFPGISCTSNVIIAAVNWNGTDYGLVNDERHGYNRDCEWHQWAHNTVGARYKSGITLTVDTGAETFATTAGEIWDEDIAFVVNASSAFPTANAGRLLYQSGDSAYSFVSATSVTPGYLGANGRPNYVNTTGYALTEMTSAVNRYINIFVYATTDNHTPIYFFTETVSAATATANGYTSLANARAVPFPNLASFGLSPELKPIYRLIWRADGALQEIDTVQDDYRTVSSLPMSAGNVSTTASTVTFNPSGNISATTVQTAIEELDAEKEPLKGSDDNYVTDAQLIVIGNTSGTNTGDNAANTSIAATKLDDFATPDDNTDLNANTTNHGLLLKATAPAAGLYNYVGITNGETAYTNKALFDATVPSTQVFGDSAAAGSAAVAARRDHKHAMMASPINGTTNEIAYLATGTTVASLAVATYPSLTELAYVKGVTSAIQTQLGLKAPLASPTFTGTVTLADNARIDLTLPTADTYCTGNTTDSFASGYSSSAGDLVFFGSSGKWLEVDADAVATCKGLIGIALEAKNDTQAMKVALPGSMVRFDAWNWTVGATLYAGETLGAMQEAIPTGADAIIKVVGFAVNADTVYFYPSPDQQVAVA